MSTNSNRVGSGGVRKKEESRWKSQSTRSKKNLLRPKEARPELKKIISSYILDDPQHNLNILLNGCCLRLMIVGDRNAGKTSFFSYLSTFFTNPTKRKKKFHTTSAKAPDVSHLPNVETVQFCFKEGEPEVTFHLWDMPGDMSHRLLHRVFYSRNCIYLVVWNIAEDNPDSVKGWIDLILSTQSKAQIVLVGTHADDDKKVPSKILCEYLRSVYPYKVVATSIENGRGYTKLLKVIEDITKSQVTGAWRQIYPHSYQDVENIIQELRRSNWIFSWDDFKYLVFQARPGADVKDEIVETVNLLHHVGSIIVVPFPKRYRIKLSGSDDKKFVIVSPGKLFELLHQIQSQEGFTMSKGRVTVNTLFETVWCDYSIRVPPLLQSIFLELLEASDVVNSLPVVPVILQFHAHLPQTKPVLHTLWPEISDLPPSVKQYSRIYKFKDNTGPPGLLHRTRALLSIYCTVQSCWVNGILVSGKKEDTRALIEEKDFDEIEISVRGKKPVYMLTMITDIIDSLLKTWYGKKPSECYVLCPHCELKRETEKDQRTHISMNQIISSVFENKAWVCLTCLVPLTPVELAPDICLGLSTAPLIKDFENDIKKLKVIGNGAFSCVHLAEYNGEKVALKVLTIPPLSDPATFFDDFHQEVSLLDTLVNKNIVVLKGFSFSPLAMLIEYLPLDSLYDWLRKKPVIDWPLRLRIVNDIASAMTYLHTFKPPILHRDLKTPNILLASSNPEADVVAKITDFGTATKLFSSFKGQTAKEREVVNPTWLSPEVILGSNYQIASDVYPIALIMWELLTGSHPFEEFDQKFNSGLEELIIKGARPTIPSSCPEKYKLLIMACWEHNYEKRPTYKMIHETLLPAIVQELCPTFYPKLANLNTDTNQPSVPNDEALFEVDGISYKVADFNEVISRYKDKQLRFREAVLYWKNKSDAIVEREKKLAEREDAVFLLEGKLRSVINLIEDNHKVDLKSFLALLPSEEEKNQMEKRRETQNEPEERESRRIAYDFDRNRRAFNNANPPPAQPSPRKRGITRSNSSPHTPKKVSANQNQEVELTISTNPIKDENDLILLKSQPIAEQSEIRKPDVSGPWSRKSMVHDMNRSTPYMGMNREKTAADSNFWNSMRYQQDPSITSTKANGLTTFQIQSGWTKENSPGALLRYNWWDTSQYIIKVIQEGVITIVLQQENKKSMPKIALHIVKADAVPRRKIKISPEDIVHKSDTYIDKDFVRLDIELTPGFYNLICSTFDPEEENAFRLVCRGAVEIFNVSNFDWLRISLTGYWRNSTPVSEGLQWEDPDSKFILFVREKGIVNICLSCREEGLCGHYGIGFTLWSREKEQIGRSNYTKRCYTVYVSEIDEGEYFIIPSTVSAGMTAPYTLQIFSSHLCHLRILK